jgi:hypothetical protein
VVVDPNAVDAHRMAVEATVAGSKSARSGDDGRLA